MCTFDIYFCTCKNTWQNLLDPKEIMTTPDVSKARSQLLILAFLGHMNEKDLFTIELTNGSIIHKYKYDTGYQSCNIELSLVFEP